MRIIASILTAVSIALCGASAAQAQESRDQAADCSNASTTIAMNECMADILSKAEARRQKYASAAYNRLADDPEVRAQLAASRL